MPARTWWQLGHCPQPWFGQSSAAANARAATDRPDPGGPVNSQACVMPSTCSPRSSRAATAAACSSSATTRSWPTRSLKTAAPLTATSPSMPAIPLSPPS